MSASEEFLPLSDTAARAVAGPNSRHTALIEDAFRVLIETPGGGVSVRGDQKGRSGARKAIESVATRADAGDAVATPVKSSARRPIYSRCTFPDPRPCWARSLPLRSARPPR